METTSEETQELVFSVEKKRSKRNNRNRIKMIADILEIARSRSLKTHIMYSCNLNYNNLNQFLSILIESGLLMEVYDVEGRTPSMARMYQTTEKGLSFLDRYYTLNGLLASKSGENQTTDW